LLAYCAVTNKRMRRTTERNWNMLSGSEQPPQPQPQPQPQSEEKDEDRHDPHELRKADIDALQIVQNTLKDKLLVVTHGPFTAEAYEPHYRAKTHEQLQIARRIRATLESAYHQAKESNSIEEAKNIFEQQRHVIYELISLTNAVQGRYVLDSYDEFIKLSEKNRMEEEKAHCDSLKKINKVRKQLYYSKRPDALLDEQVALHFQKKIKSSRKQSTFSPAKEQRLKEVPPPLPRLPGLGLPELQTTSFASNHNASFTKISNASTMLTDPQKPSSLSHSSNYTPKKSPKPMFHNTRSRKCHFCDSWSIIHRRCTYWHKNGTQCRKSFCLKCLTENPNFEQEASSTEEQWHCPSCLGHCECHKCKKLRLITTG